MHAIKMTFAAAVACVGMSLASSGASAMPVSALKAAAGEASATTQVGWVCGPFRCWWRPSYYAPVYGFYAPHHYRYGFYGPRFRIRL